MKHGLAIYLLKRASVGSIDQALTKKASTRHVETAAHGASTVGRKVVKGVGKYLSSAGRVGGALAKGLGAGESGQAIGKSLAMGGAAYLPIKLLGATEAGQRVEGMAARGIGAASRGLQRTVAPTDPYAGQY